MEKTEALAKFKEQVSEGDTLYCVLRHVSRSGMMRRVSLFYIRDNQPYCLDYLTEPLTGYKRAKLGHGEGIRIGGCGMDMGFSLVYDIAKTVFGDGYKLHHVWL